MNENYKKRIEDLEYSLNKSKKKETLFDEIQRKIAENVRNSHSGIGEEDLRGKATAGGDQRQLNGDTDPREGYHGARGDNPAHEAALVPDD